jgi:hypothetical protein
MTGIAKLIGSCAAMALGSGLLAASAAADIPIGTTKQPTSIRSWGGVAAFSLYDEASRSYRLAVSRHHGPPQVVAVAAQAAAFDLDVGPDEAGSPAIVYSRCAVTGLRPRGCDLYRYSLATGTESKLAGASSAHASEFAPTIWRDRIAWARVSDAGARRAPRIYSRSLRSPLSRRSGRLPGIPSSLCGKYTCVVNELELRERRLAVNGGYPGPVCNNGQIRLDSLGGRSIEIANTTCGLNGQSFVGVSFDARNLYFARFCVADPTCGRTGAFRYSLRSARYSLAGFGARLTGFSFNSGSRAYEVLAPTTGPNGYCGNSVEGGPLPDCRIVLSDPLVFARARAPH